MRGEAMSFFPSMFIHFFQMRIIRSFVRKSKKLFSPTVKFIRFPVTLFWFQLRFC